VLRKTIPAVDDSLGEVTLRVQTTSVFGDLNCVSSCSCNTAERKHAAEAYSGPPFVHSEVVLLRFQNVSCRSVSVGFAEKTSLFGSV